jgi:DtxR family Mn-dependent transcriptional regulator
MGVDAMTLSSSLEDYLEAMIEIRDHEGRIRITDISQRLEVEKPSVNTAVNKLQNLALVVHEKYGEIELTKRGEAEAERVRQKHRTITRFLSDFLGLAAGQAERDACKIEHVMSAAAIERLSRFMAFVDVSPLAGGDKWKRALADFLEGKNGEGADHE